MGISVERGLRAFGLCLTAWLSLGASAWAQTVPAPSQVAPPVIVPPTGGGHIAIPQVPAGAQVPEQAKKLNFKLLGFDLQGGFEELAAAYKELAAPLVGRRVTVADIFVFASFSEGFGNLHTRSYEEILKGNGFGLDAAMPSIQITHDIREAVPVSLQGDYHPFIKSM